MSASMVRSLRMVAQAAVVSADLVQKIFLVSLAIFSVVRLVVAVDAVNNAHVVDQTFAM